MKSMSKSIVAIALAASAGVASAQTPSNAAQFAEQFWQQQALSSGSGSLAFKPAPSPVDAADSSIRSETFAERFARLQAESSSSGEFATAPHGAYAAVGNRPSLRERLARIFQRGATTTTN
jgi:hypothetical protein